MAKQLDMRKWHEEMRQDPERLRKFLREVMGPPHRTLEGKKREEIWFSLKYMQPISESNNQHSWTQVFKMNENEYHVTTFPESNDIPIIDEYPPEEIDNK